MDFRKLDAALNKIGNWRNQMLFDGKDGDFYGFTALFSRSRYFSLKLLEQQIELVVSKGVEEGWIGEEERLVCYDVTAFDDGAIKALFVTPEVAKIYDDLKATLGVSQGLYDISMSRLDEDSRHSRYDIPREELATLFFLASLPTFYYPFKAFERVYEILWDGDFFRFHMLLREEVEEIKKATPWLPNAQLMLAMTNTVVFTKTQSAGTLPANMFEENFFRATQTEGEVLSRQLRGRGIPVECSVEFSGENGEIFPVWVTDVRVSGKHGDTEYNVEFSYVPDPWAGPRHGKVRDNQVNNAGSGLLGYRFRVVPEFDENGYIFGVSRILAIY